MNQACLAEVYYLESDLWALMGHELVPELLSYLSRTSIRSHHPTTMIHLVFHS
jgi:hypothetical protein